MPIGVPFDCPPTFSNLYLISIGFAMNRCFTMFGLLSSLLLLAGCGATPSPQAMPTPVVEVALPIVRDNVVDYEDFTGRTDAVDRVDVRARVSGYLNEVRFKDGDFVKKDQLLYQIDPRPFQDALDAAKGTLERLQAQKKLLDIQVERYRKLAAQSAASQQDVDQYLAQQAENIGAIKTAEAQIKTAELNLSFTRVTSPISGKISRTLLTIGNLVNADTTLLTTIMSIDPMYAYFNVEEPTLLNILRLKRDGQLKERMNKITMRIGLVDDVDRKFPLSGILDFSNNTIDPQTGTIQVRGKIDNPYKGPELPPLLVPGMFIRVRLDIGVPHRVLLIPQQAVGTDQGQKFLYVLDKDNKVLYRPVKLGQLFDGLQAVTDGLKADERVVTQGLQRIRPNDVVKPEMIEVLKKTK
jgi:RND family efflux transporter MFP subunit